MVYIIQRENSHVKKKKTGIKGFLNYKEKSKEYEVLDVKIYLKFTVTKMTVLTQE